MENESNQTRKWKTLWSGTFFQVALITILGILTYSNTFSVPFVFDDESSITGNHVIKNLSDFLAGSGYRYNPRRFIGYLTIALNYHWGGADVTGYHVVNLAIHIVSALLVYSLARLTLQTPFFAIMNDEPHRSRVRDFLPLLAALLFVSHPVQTQAVTYIIQRLASLSTLFFLLSLVLYARGRLCGTGQQWKAWGLYLLSFITAVLAMRTKEIAFTLPLVMVLYELVFFCMTRRKALLLSAPVLLLLVIIPLSVIGSGHGIDDLMTAMDEKTRVQTDLPRLHYLLTQVRVIVTYLRLLILPVNQNLDYDYPVYSSFFSMPVLVSFLFLLAIATFGAYLLYSTRRAASPTAATTVAGGGGWFAAPEYRLAGFGILWFFITLSVESSIIPIVDVIFEHRLYLPSVGSFLAASAIAAVALRHVPPVRVVVAAACILAALTAATFARNQVWGDTLTLARDIAEKSPRIARTHYNLALALIERGRADEALREARISADLDREDARPRHLIGSILAKQGHFEEAVKELTLAVTLFPEAAYSHANLGYLYLSKGMTGQAMEHLLTAFRLTPDDADLCNNIGTAYSMAANHSEAVLYFQRAVELDPLHPWYRANLERALAASPASAPRP